MINEAEVDRVLNDVGPRLRRLRIDRGVTLAELSAITGISVSTLSRLEGGQRRANLELLLPIAAAHQVPLDDLVGTPAAADPRITGKPVKVEGFSYQPLTRQPGGLQAYRIGVPARRRSPELTSHEGYEWLYVLSGTLRLILADHDIELTEGEAAELDASQPHWYGSAGRGATQLLAWYSRPAERVHVRGRTGRR